MANFLGEGDVSREMLESPMVANVTHIGNAGARDAGNKPEE